MIDFQLRAIPQHYPQEFRGEIAKIASIFETNAFNIISTTEGGISGIFSSASPNANQIWNSRIESLTIHAIKDILIGEEITISYVSTMLDRDQRQSVLQYYGILCTCAACDASSEGVIDRSKIEQPFSATIAIHELIELMLAEGLVGVELSRWYVYYFLIMQV